MYLFCCLEDVAVSCHFNSFIFPHHKYKCPISGLMQKLLLCNYFLKLILHLIVVYLDTQI